jgi:hypothetical protein
LTVALSVAKATAAIAGPHAAASLPPSQRLEPSAADWSCGWQPSNTPAAGTPAFSKRR